MLNAPKALASLSSTLLARKGHARPAMRPQGFGGMTPNASLDDLGWNDMGGEPAPAPAPMLAAVPVEEAPPTPASPVAMPPVLIQREALRGIETPAPVVDAPEVPEAAPEPVATIELRPVSLATATRIGRETTKQLKKNGKAAFTLRLDGERHLRLRLASALSNRSSQQLVTEALDALLATLPQVEALAGQLPARNTR